VLQLVYGCEIIAMFLGDDLDSEVKIEINESYAGRYNSWRQKEELQKCKCNTTV
jgi:hypothetical protein